jgi:outer membrane lipoprotein-sorting protein
MFVIMQVLRFGICLLFIFIFAGADTGHKTVSCREIIDQMLDSVKNVKTQRYRVKSTERISGHLLFASSIIKIDLSTKKKIYLFNPEKNIEVLWVTGKNNGNAIVRSGSVPLMNFNLDPYGSIMRKDQHHTIFDLGFQYIGMTIANTILKAPKDFDKHFQYAGTIKYDNHDCHQVVINYPEYKFIEYVTGKGETVTSISLKLNTSDYKIRYINDLSSYFGTIKEGKKLKIPIPYANKAIVYIDKKSAIPLSIKVYDDEGLFESYDFSNVVINKPFAEDEFSKSYKDYGF